MDASKLLWILKDELSKFNTHVVNNEICYGGCVKDNPIGIGFYRDLKNIKWALTFYQAQSISKITVNKNADGSCDYTINFNDDTSLLHILAFNRVGLGTVPIGTITGTALASALTETMINDNFSYTMVGEKNTVIVALDLFKLILNKEKKEKLIEIIEDVEERSILKQNDKSLTLCCVLNLKDNTFRFARLNVKTIAGDRPQKIKLSREIHSNNKIQNYVKKIVGQEKENKEKIGLINEIIKAFPVKHSKC